MNDDETDNLRKQIAALHSKTDAIFGVLKREIANTTASIERIYKNMDEVRGEMRGKYNRLDKDMDRIVQHMADLRDIVMPLEEHIFPNAREAREKLGSILGKPTLGAGSEHDRKKI